MNRVYSPGRHNVGKHRRLRSQLIERRKLQPRKPLFVHLLVRKLIQHNPNNPLSRLARRQPAHDAAKDADSNHAPATRTTPTAQRSKSRSKQRSPESLRQPAAKDFKRRQQPPPAPRHHRQRPAAHNKPRQQVDPPGDRPPETGKGLAQNPRQSQHRSRPDHHAQTPATFGDSSSPANNTKSATT